MMGHLFLYVNKACPQHTVNMAVCRCSVTECLLPGQKTIKETPLKRVIELDKTFCLQARDQPSWGPTSAEWPAVYSLALSVLRGALECSAHSCGHPCQERVPIWFVFWRFSCHKNNPIKTIDFQVSKTPSPNPSCQSKPVSLTSLCFLAWYS